MDVEIRTPRLLLRPQREADIPAIMAGLNDWQVARWLTAVPYPYSRADAEEWIGRQTPPVPGQAHFAIDLQGAGLIGVATLDSELGYWLASSEHGRGYMTEACTALLEWHFASLPDSVVPSGYHAGNAASAAVQRKLGFVESGARDMRFVRSQGREVEHVNTSLTREQFEASAARRGRM
ncbi:MAG TPA: GNAT family N-acetyltransferase [Devosia sp.]|nr:GNAT family N-acetyltransferase [Devosia sp.]